MLHLITEIGKPGRQERERRHFPELVDKAGDDYPPKPRGRRYIPHGYGDEYEFNPHPHFMEPQYTDCGPDWKSRLRRIPSPHNPDYKPEIWPEPWKSMRTFPWMSSRTKQEWTLYPEGYDVTMRCSWAGTHKRTELSTNEITDNMLYGKNKKVVDKRNGMPFAAPGDKNYQAVEYSHNFHKLGSTLPLVNFGGDRTIKPDTFVPLQELPLVPRENYVQKERMRKKHEEVAEVWDLEKWRPATPLGQNVNQNEERNISSQMGK